MRQLSATEASRRFSEVLDEVERVGESFLIVRHGRTVATLGPATGASGKALIDALRGHRPDGDWAGELRELRRSIDSDADRWRD